MTSLTILDAMPDGLLECGARDLHHVLNGPTLIELPGASGAPLFVSVLMHGNEDSGLGAIQRVLSENRGQGLPRPMMLMIGNVRAARQGKRRLPDQPDYNRVWPGAESDQNSTEAHIMAQVHARVIKRKCFAAIDIHNNTGRNPHYSVICTRDRKVERLAARFARRAVLFRGLPGTQTASFGAMIPAITIECGQPGRDENAEAAARFVRSVLQLTDLSTSADPELELDLFHTLAQVKVKPDVGLSNPKRGQWLRLVDDLDRLNFESADSGCVIGTTNHPMPLEVIDEQGRDVARNYFAVEEGSLRLTRSIVPAMLTSDEQIVRQDCLCYLMERLV